MKLPKVAEAIKGVNEADAVVCKARGLAADLAPRLQQATSAEQDLKRRIASKGTVRSVPMETQ